MANPVIVVLGAGPGIGYAVARRFGRAGYDVALVARSEQRLEQLGLELETEGVTAGWSVADVKDTEALTSALRRVGEHSGSIDHLHFNPSSFTGKDALTLTANELLSDLHLGVASLLTAVQAAKPFMPPGARITATGGATADHPWAATASLGVQKAGLRNLVNALDATLAGDGIRALSLTVAGTVEVGTAFDPGLIADALFESSQAEDEFWQSEVRYTGRD
ncbi:MAG: SDR family NAD(P)-dependent oxidoreductase [Nocardioidaceae bacterium]